MTRVAFQTAPALKRFVAFFCLWLMIAGASPHDLPLAAIVACGSVWVSLRLAPPRHGRLRLTPMAALAGRFLRGSVVAGLDVAFRALSPRLRLQPGFVACPLSDDVREIRDAFCFYQSLQPGMLPTGVENGLLMVHALDTKQPVAQSLAADEILFREAIAP